MDPEPTAIDIVSLLLGAFGLLASIGGLIYAFAAAKKSDQVLRRLVVYPFRDLDRRYSELTETERAFLKDYTDLTGITTNRTTQEAVEELIRSSDAYSASVLDYLVRKGWLVKHPDDRYSLNGDRLPYLAFLIEAEG